MALTLGTGPGPGKSIFWSFASRDGLPSSSCRRRATMTPTETVPTDRSSRIAWVTVAEELLPVFAARAAAHDDDDTFVAENFADLRRHRLFSAPIPAELGGGDASPAEMCEVLPTLAHGCSSTALAVAIHTPQGPIPAPRVRHQR